MPGVFRPQDQNGSTLRVDVIAPKGCHGWSEGANDFVGIGLHVFRHAVGSFSVNYSDNARIALESAFHVQWFPRIGFFVFRDAEGVFAGVAVLTKVYFTRNGATDVD